MPADLLEKSVEFVKFRLLCRFVVKETYDYLNFIDNQIFSIFNYINNIYVLKILRFIFELNEYKYIVLV